MTSLKIVQELFRRISLSFVNFVMLVCCVEWIYATIEDAAVDVRISSMFDFTAVYLEIQSRLSTRILGFRESEKFYH